MSSIEKARGIQATIRSLVGANANGLIAVPEIERDTTPDAIRKLQIQVFELSDALAAVVAELDRLKDGGR